MRKPLLDNSVKAKSDFKAMMRPGTFLLINISGWQIADPNNAEAETTLALAVPSEGVLSCGEPTCSARSRSFGGGGLCAARPQIKFSAEGASGGDFPVWAEMKGKSPRPHFRCQLVGTAEFRMGSAAESTSAQPSTNIPN